MERFPVIRLLFFMVVQVCSVMVVVAIAADPAYPNKPIRVIVPIAAGGQTDVMARLLAQRLSEIFKQPLVVENRTGAGGSVGTEIAVKANPDGYTILLVASTYAANAALHKLPYDPVKDVTPIIFLGETGFVISVYPTVPVKSIKELIAYEKNNPGKLIYGSGGAGSTTHLATELFNQMTGTRMLHVPYKGSGPALNELIGGQVQLVTVGMPLALPQVKANRIRGLAVTTTKRSISLPDLPAVADTVPGYEAISWFAIYGPKGLSADIAQRWNGEINRILQLSDIKDRIASLGIEPVGGSADRLRDITRREILKWQNVVKLANIKPED